MSENLKRAESLFNRIMNQNSHDSLVSSSSTTTTNTNTPTLSTPPISTSTPLANHQSSSSSFFPSDKQSSSNIRKLDVEKLTQEALSTVPFAHHTLLYCWTIWYHSRNTASTSTTKKRTTDQKDEPVVVVEEGGALTSGVDSYLQTTNEIKFVDLITNKNIQYIASLEQLWSSLTSIKKTYSLNIGTEFLIFKTGVNPVWEDPINSKGGRWVFRFNRKVIDDDYAKQEKLRKRSCLIWERLVLKTLTGSLIPNSNTQEIQDLLLNDICGLVLSVRKDEDIISLWNSNLNFYGGNLNSNKKDSKKLITSFQARRIICDSILRVIRECDLILQGNNDCIETLDTGSNERVYGVSFEYRVHADNEREKEKVMYSGNTSSSLSSPSLNTNNNNNNNNTNGYHGHHYNRKYNNNNNRNSLRESVTSTTH